MRQVMKMKRLSVEIEEKSPLMPIAIMPWRMSGGSGSNELTAKLVVVLIVDLIITLGLRIPILEGAKGVLEFLVCVWPHRRLD